jgi:hypothetical protein
MGAGGGDAESFVAVGFGSWASLAQVVVTCYLVFASPAVCEDWRREGVVGMDQVWSETRVDIGLRFASVWCDAWRHDRWPKTGSVLRDFSLASSGNAFLGLSPRTGGA